VPSALATAKLYLNLRQAIWEELLPRSAHSWRSDELALAHARAAVSRRLSRRGPRPTICPRASVCSMTSGLACAPTRRTWCGRFAWARPASGALRASTALEWSGGLETLRQSIEDRIHYELMKGQDMLLTRVSQSLRSTCPTWEKKDTSRRLDEPGLSGDALLQRASG